MKQLLYLCSVCEQGVSQTAARCPHCGEDFGAPTSDGVVLNPEHPDYRATRDRIIHKKLQASHEQAQQEATATRASIRHYLILIAIVAVIVLAVVSNL